MCFSQDQEQNSANDGIAFALAAATEALEEADWKPHAYEDRVRTVSIKLYVHVLMPENFFFFTFFLLSYPKPMY